MAFPLGRSVCQALKRSGSLWSRSRHVWPASPVSALGRSQLRGPHGGLSLLHSALPIIGKEMFKNVWDLKNDNNVFSIRGLPVSGVSLVADLHMWNWKLSTINCVLVSRQGGPGALVGKSR